MLYIFSSLPVYVVSAAIFLLILLFNWLGYIFKNWLIVKHPGRVPENIGAVEGSLLGILGLLLAFTFSVAMSKYEARRQITVDEANKIGTAILRCDMYPDSIRNPLRANFKEYVEARIAYYAAGDDEEKIQKELKTANEISGRIWKTAALQSQNRENFIVSNQMIPILNAMIDTVTTRDASRISSVPLLILWVLLSLVVMSAFVLGSDYNGKKRNKILILSYAIAMSLTLNLINELNRPRSGLITLDAVEQKMIELRELVK